MSLLTPTPEAIQQAADLLKAGGIVAFPTATLYGLGADARNAAAVEKVYAAKGRPSVKPLIVIAGTKEALEREVVFNSVADELATHFWPGPLTIVLPLRPDTTIAPIVTAGGPTCAVRVESHPVTRDLMQAFGGLIVAPSANLADDAPPTTPQEVLQSLGAATPLVLAAGKTDSNVASTLIDVTAATPRILREGAISREQIQHVIGRVD
ncbi:MAG: L-threonylcarbamoyladenylate synthase [Bdellovibrionales bacterium]